MTNRWILFCCVCLVPCVAGLAGDAPSKQDEPFKAIPPADLNRQVDLYIQGFVTALADSSKYEDESRRVTKDAHTLAALAMALAHHESEHPRKATAGALAGAAQKLAAAKDYQAAKAALVAVKTLAAADTSSGGVIVDPIAPQGQLMKQVTFVNNRLRRNMRRFDDKSADLALDAAVLSVIAQAVAHDYSAVKNPEEKAKWHEFSCQMRDSAGELNAQFHQKNRQEADAALGKLTKSCDQCHAIFRKQLLPTKE